MSPKLPRTSGDLAQPRAVRAHRRSLRAPRRSRARRRAGPGARAHYHAASCAPAPSSTAKQKTRIAEINKRPRRRWRPSSARTCLPTSSPGVWCSKESRSRRPAGARARAAPRRRRRGLAGKSRDHAVALHDRAFLNFSARRDLREEAFKAWTSAARTAADRQPRDHRRDHRRCGPSWRGCSASRATPTSALDDTMAKTPASVRGLLDQVWTAGLKRATEEREALESSRARGGRQLHHRAWDWRYYAEKVRKARFDLDEAEMRPYLQLDNIDRRRLRHRHAPVRPHVRGAPDVPRYHPDVRAWEVTDTRRRARRPFPRRLFRPPLEALRRLDERVPHAAKLGGDVRPIVVNVMNFARGAEGEPTLLSFDDARTLFHEFGHGLHGLLSDVTYPSSPAPRVARFRRAALAALRALADASRGAGAVRAPSRDRQADAGRCWSASRRRATSTRASRRSSTPPRRWSTWSCTPRRTRAPRHRRVRARAAGSLGMPRRSSCAIACRTSSTSSAAMRPATTATCGRR